MGDNSTITPSQEEHGQFQLNFAHIAFLDEDSNFFKWSVNNRDDNVKSNILS